MGFTAVQVDELSLWQFIAQIDGYVDANTPEDAKTETLSDAEVDDLSAWMSRG